MKVRIRKHDGMWWLWAGPYWVRFSSWQEAVDRFEFMRKEHSQ